jgi:hypothetical protein
VDTGRGNIAEGGKRAVSITAFPNSDDSCHNRHVSDEGGFSGDRVLAGRLVEGLRGGLIAMLSELQRGW